MKKWLKGGLLLLAVLCFAFSLITGSHGCWGIVGRSQAKSLASLVMTYRLSNNGDLPRFWRELYLYGHVNTRRQKPEDDLTRRYAWLPERPSIEEGRVLLATAHPFEENGYLMPDDTLWCHLLVMDEKGFVDVLSYPVDEYRELLERNNLRIPPATPYNPDYFERGVLSGLGRHWVENGTSHSGSGVDLKAYIEKLRREKQAEPR